MPVVLRANSKTKETTLEFSAIIQAIDDGGLDQSGSSGDGKKW